MNGERKKGKYKVKYTMYRVFRSDNQYRKKYGQKCDEVKCTHGLYLQNTFALQVQGKGIKLLY
jgi:hypothetical protein